MVAGHAAAPARRDPRHRNGTGRTRPCRTGSDRAVLAGFDLRSGLGSITAPTLVVSGRSDGLNPPEAGEEVARHIPNARFVVYERSGHLLAAEETERLVADTVAFVLS